MAFSDTRPPMGPGPGTLEEAIEVFCDALMPRKVYTRLDLERITRDLVGFFAREVLEELRARGDLEGSQGSGAMEGFDDAGSP